jgi:hypothetical protein
MFRTLVGLFFGLGVAVLVCGSVRADAQATIAITSGDEQGTVVACWEGTRAIQPLDCVGREAVAVTSPSTGVVGRVIRKSLAEATAVTRAEGGYAPGSSILFAEPIPLRSPAEMPEPDWLEDSDSLAVFVPTREQNVVLPFRPPVTTPPFDAGKARAALWQMLSQSYSKIEPTDPIWVDVDGDRIPEAVVIARASEDPWCADLITVQFQRDGQIRDPGALAARLAANRCRYPDFLTMREDCQGEIIPWPLEPSAYALALNCTTSGGDGWSLKILPLASLLSELKIAVDYGAVWYLRPYKTP